ncbi:CaiB/BaiF CoA-transferase family protein [Nitratireductor sp. ZSWI3]|uniref:CaiB/BaiF CoA transferase family protein n=1 Tax=Nitratireductor sp. ZSWI3 TaxID=2966359 RepID=UPI00215051E6|nr:CoA transferase [Nitratireductor sp. ZSWI3]MCR4265390.1 CoA transferase [Nitratireductor sp. ZSWI3]
MAESAWKPVDYTPDARGPLSGLVVLDLSRLVAGNMTSLQMADFGAEVIKVEPLPAGDPLRAWKQAGHSTFWKVYGRNKKSIALDFRKDGAVDLLRRLIARADVMIESFRPGTLEKMGLGPDVLERDFPRLVLLRVSGFGQSGPYSPRPGFGTLVEGMSGFAHRNGEEGGDPLLPPLALADMISGLYGANAVMMALRARDQDGRGQVIDLSLLDAMVSVLGPEPLDYQITGRPKPRVGNGSNTSSPRNVYRTRDGHFIAISASIQKTAERLFRTIGRQDMIEDPRYATNEARVSRRPEVDAIVGGWIGERDRDEVLEIFERDGITAAPLYDIADIAADRHFVERGIFVSVPDADHGRIPTHAPLPRLSATPGALRGPAPALGAHSREILRSAGFDDAEIEAVTASGIVKAEDAA